MTAIHGAPIDAADRERLLTEQDRTFFVEAGAGTGKTTVLVGRIVNLVAAGCVDMASLAAITFTEAAAAELRDRVREGLEKTADDPARTDEERRRCLVAAAEIDLAAIQTIHAFAGGLLRAYPLEAGLPPGLAQLDEIEQDARFEERFRAWFWGDALRPPVGDAVRRALLLGLTQHHLRELALALEGQHDLLTPTTVWPCAPPDEAISAAREVGGLLAEADDCLQYARNGLRDPLAQVVVRAQPWAGRLQACTTEEDALVALLGLGALKTRGSQSNWSNLPDGTNACRALKALIAELNERVAMVLEGHRAASLSRVLEALRDFTLAGVRERRADGVATFQDLLAWARDLLRDHAEVRRRAQSRYQRLFVDEFQDTDPLQAEIVFYLAADPEQPLPTDWRDIPLVPGKLFVVGDPKQSIYRFRRADIGVYDDLQQRLIDGRVYLVQNFRSVSPVLDWVNHHFTARMQASPRIQPAYVDLHPHRSPFAEGARSGVYRVGTAVGGNAAAVAAAEAQALVATAHTAVEEGWLVAARDDAGNPLVREAGYGDICILIRSRTHLRTLERALEEGDVPYRVESGKLVLATQEVRELLAGLRAIDDPSDQVALVGALRSPAFACSDPDLLTWVEGGGRLDYEAPGDGPDGPVKQALVCLADFHARRHLLSPPALIEAYIAERLLAEAAFGEPRPRESWRRLRYVISRARQLTTTGRHSLRAFLDWIDGLERAEARDVESAEAEPDDVAVRILTIHKSKGLEFPIVLLSGLGAGRVGRSDAVEVIADRQTGTLACHVGKEWRTMGFEEVQAHEQQLADAELVRLLYVATTRARDHLVLSLFRASTAVGSMAALIEDRLKGANSLCHPLSLALDGPRMTSADDESRDLATGAWGTEADESVWLAHRHELVERHGTERRVSNRAVTQLAETDEPPADIDETSPASLAQKVRALVRRSGPGRLQLYGDEDEQVVARGQAIVDSPVFKEAVANPTCHRDVPLLAVVNGAVLDVVADLVYETDSGIALVGYQIGGVDSSADAAYAPARAAAAILARAFSAAAKRPAQSVDIIEATDGTCSHFQVARDLGEEPDSIAARR